MTPIRIPLSELPAREGEHLGTSPWHTVTQDEVNQFAEATGDHQWIHVDPERAASGPFGRTIVHGFLTLSLSVALLDKTLLVDECSTVINYGLNRVRFPTFVPVGSNVRLAVSLTALEEQKDGSLQATYALSFELEGSEKPCCIAESLLRYYP